MSTTDQFGERLRRARSEIGLSVAAICERADLSPADWERWEAGGRIPRADHAIKAAIAVNVPLPTLVFGELRARQRPAIALAVNNDRKKRVMH